MRKYIGNLPLLVDSNGNPVFSFVNAASFLATSANGSVDAFARQRMSSPLTLFDSKLTEDARPLFWDDAEVSGSGTTSVHSVADASVVMSVGASTAGTRVRQTFRRFNYQPGKSQLVIMTGNFGAGEAGVIKRIGYFDDNNGLFFQQNGTSVGVGIRTSTSGSPVTTVVNQIDWNIDKLNGTGASGKTLDVTKSQIYFIDFEWLGVGQVRYGVFIDGAPVYVHAETNFNALTSVYMSSPNLPCRYEISNDGTGDASSLRQICTTVISEGGQELTGSIRAVSRGLTPITTGNNTLWTPLISLRLKSTHLGVTVDIITSHVICTSVANYEIAAFFNPTIGGVDAAAWVGLPDSAIEYDISRSNTNTLTDGVMLQGTFGADTNRVRFSQNVNVVNAVRLGAKIDGTRDQIVLAVRNLSSGADTYHARLEWRELL